VQQHFNDIGDANSLGLILRRRSLGFLRFLTYADLGEGSSDAASVVLAAVKDKPFEARGDSGGNGEVDPGFEEGFPKFVTPFNGDADRFISDIIEPIADVALMLTDRPIYHSCESSLGIRRPRPSTR
jgi:hypothetical protein